MNGSCGENHLARSSWRLIDWPLAFSPAMLRAAAYSFLLRPWRAAIAFSAFSLVARPDTRALRAGEGAADRPRTLPVSLRFSASGARWLLGRSADSVLASFGETMTMEENWRFALPGKEQTWRDRKDALGIALRAANMYASAQEIKSINAPRGATIFCEISAVTCAGPGRLCRSGKAGSGSLTVTDA